MTGLAETMTFGNGNANVNHYYAGDQSTPKRKITGKSTMKPKKKCKSKSKGSK